MQFFVHQNEPGILVTTMEGIHDKPGVNSQNDKSIFGLYSPRSHPESLTFFLWII